MVGVLKYQDLEGGFWSLVTQDGTVYQLAGDVSFDQFSEGDMVEVEELEGEFIGIGMVDGGVLVINSIKQV